MRLQCNREPAILQRRYKRFLADIETDAGELLTIHCPNTGSMRHCAEPGSQVWFTTSDNAKRKYPQTWEISRTPAGHWIGINTSRTNALVEEALARGVIQECAGYREVRREASIGSEGSRADFLLRHHEGGRPECFIEVKNVTLLEDDGNGYFPDAVSVRAAKHLRELMHVVSQGGRAVLLYVVNHSGIASVQAAAHIDPTYAATLREATAAGVEVYAYRTQISPESIEVTEAVPTRLA